MTTRIPNGRNPIRIILDSTLRIPMEANVVTDGELLPGYLQQVIMQRKKIALENAGVKVFVTSREKHINLHKMLDVLGQKEFPPCLLKVVER